MFFLYQFGMKDKKKCKNGFPMKQWLLVLKIFILVIGGLFGCIFIFIVFNKRFFSFDPGLNIDAELASQFGDFVGGFIGTLFAFLSILVVGYSILK